MKSALACTLCAAAVQGGIVLPALASSPGSMSHLRQFTFEQQAGQRLLRTGTTVRKAAQVAIPPRGRMSGSQRQVMTLEFRSHGYFVPHNLGHFAIGLRGDALTDVSGDGRPDVRGRGVVIGNVSAYPHQPGHAHCAATAVPNTVAIESFWAGGNCVHGQATPPDKQVALTNGQWYRLRLESGPDCRSGTLRIGYVLWMRQKGGWQRIAQAEVDDDARNTTPRTLDGWFIGEVFSTHDWRFEVRKLTLRAEPTTSPDCAAQPARPAPGLPRLR